MKAVHGRSLALPRLAAVPPISHGHHSVWGSTHPRSYLECGAPRPGSGAGVRDGEFRASRRCTICRLSPSRTRLRKQQSHPLRLLLLPLPPGPGCVWRIADLCRKSAIRHTQVAIGREPSNAAAVRGYAAEGRGLAHTSGIRRVQREANLDDGAGLAGKVSADAPGKRVLSGRCVLAGGETGSFRRQWEHCRPIPAETLAGSDRPAYTGVGSGVKTEIPVKMPRKRKSLAFVF